MGWSSGGERGPPKLYGRDSWGVVWSNGGVEGRAFKAECSGFLCSVWTTHSTEAGTVRRLCRGDHPRANTQIIIRQALEEHGSDARSAPMRAATGGASTVCSLRLSSPSAAPCLAFLVFSLHSSSFLLYSRFLPTPYPLLHPLIIVVVAAAAAAV